MLRGCGPGVTILMPDIRERGQLIMRQKGMSHHHLILLSVTGPYRIFILMLASFVYFWENKCLYIIKLHLFFARSEIFTCVSYSGLKKVYGSSLDLA